MFFNNFNIMLMDVSYKIWHERAIRSVVALPVVPIQTRGWLPIKSISKIDL